MDKEILEIPKEMVDLMIDWRIYTECRDVAISSFFKAKRAIYYGRLAYKANADFWRLANELYPQLKNETWFYDQTKEKIIKKT